MVSAIEAKNGIESFIVDLPRFFNDTEIRSTQKQAIASKQNVHTLTVNRADLTDGGECLSANKDALIH